MYVVVTNMERVKPGVNMHQEYGANGGRMGSWGDARVGRVRWWWVGWEAVEPGVAPLLHPPPLCFHFSAIYSTSYPLPIVCHLVATTMPPCYIPLSHHSPTSPPSKRIRNRRGLLACGDRQSVPAK